MGGTSGLLSSQGKGCVSNSTSLDTLDGIALRSKDPRVMRHHSPNHQWDMHKRSLFLLTTPWSREDSISPRVLYKHLLFHRQARDAKICVEARDSAHMPGIQGFKGVSTPLHHRLSLEINRLYRVCFCYLAFGQGYFFILVHRIHSSLHHV